MHLRGIIVLVAALMYGAPCRAQETVNDDVRSIAARLGITPESVLVADVAAYAEAMLQRIEDATALRAQLAEQRAAAGQLRDLLDAATAALAYATDDSSLADERDALLDQYAQARLVIEQTLAELRTIALEGIPVDGVNRLHGWRANVHWRVPAAFRALDYPAETWRLTEQALSTESRALRRAASPPAWASDALAMFRTDPNVISAAQRLEFQLSSMRELFAQYASGSSE